MIFLKRLTKRVADVWESAAFSSIFLASSFSCSQAESTPAPAPVPRRRHAGHTQTVRRWLIDKASVSTRVVKEQNSVMAILDNILLAVFIISLLGSGCLSLWRLFKDSENEAKCPNCRGLWAAEKLGEKIMGIFRKDQLRLIRGKGFPRASDYKMVEYEKYEIHYRCKYCSHEWTFLKSRKL
jgi:Zn-finger nucleic acid-binding protein